VTPKQKALFERAKRFILDYGFVPMLVEETMTSPHFGGSLDAVGTFSRKFWKDDKKFWARPTEYAFEESDPWIVDWKVSSNWDDLHPIQGYGYMRLLKLVKQLEIPRFAIARINPKKDDGVEVRGYWLPDYADEWEACFKLWQFTNKAGKWKTSKK
jgi:hypothetical protein